MSTNDQVFEQAMALHRADRLQAAEQMYRRVLALDPSHHDARCLLGAICQAQGRMPEAVEHLTQALLTCPDDAEVRFDLGMILAGAGRLDEGISHLQAACRLRPQSKEFATGLAQTQSASHSERAADLAVQGNLEAAEQHCRRAAQLTPDAPTPLLNLAAILKARERLAEANECYRRVLKFDPSAVEARRGLGHIHLQQGRQDEAAHEFRQVLAARADDLDALNGLGMALAQGGHFRESADHFRRLTTLQPDNAAALSFLGAMLGVQGHYREASATLHRAIELNPALPDAHANLGDVLKDQNQCAAAAESYRRAIRLQPDFADAHLNLALALLLEGCLAEAWPEFEWRWKTTCTVPAHAMSPRWQGERLPQGTILLHNEQGIGDCLQFARYAPLVRQRVGRVVVEVAPALVGLLTGSPGIDRVVARGEPTGPFDIQASLMSLPGVFGTTLETIVAPRSYLAPPEDLVAAWRSELVGESRLKVGIAWQGNPGHLRDRDRSIPLSEFAPLGEIKGVRLYSLQWGPGREQLNAPAPRPAGIVDLGDRLGDFSTMAAFVRNLDLVITCDSAPAHLAGALGVDVWVALAFAPDWRWLLERSDSPWYPTMRLFRQTTPGEWRGVFAEIASALRERTAANKSSYGDAAGDSAISSA